MTLETAPLWICFLPQFVSVVGDSFGQRCCRVYNHSSRRRFIISMCIITCLQMFVGLTIFQLAAPKLTSVIYEVQNKTHTVDYCDTEKGKGSKWCYAQGPLTIYKAIWDCPLLLTNGLVSMAYYLCEATLYQQSIGIVMLVLAALSSTFIIAPLQNAAHLPGGGPVPPIVMILGILGSVVCVAEKKAKRHSPYEEAVLHEGEAGSLKDQGSASINDTLSGMEQSPLTASPASATDGGTTRSALTSASGRDLTTAPAPTKKQRVVQLLCFLRSHLPLLFPFAVLATVYAVYFVMMLLYNDHCRMNMWGYNGVDQVLLPLYLLLTFLLIDTCPKGMRDVFTANEDKEERFVEALKGAFRETVTNRGEGFWNIFIYRLLINGRAMAYSYIAVRYDLGTSYLQLTLIRVVLSWLASLCLVLVFPRFIRATVDEQRSLKDPVNIALKVIGTILIVGSLLILHKKSL